MIPVKLELLNFLAYRSPEPLDLTGIHMACLVGANGAGKSSLLDAMTWALWGKARAHSDNELIHGEEIEMQVRLTFALEGNQYRVTRYRSRKGQGSSLLTLEVQDNDDWRSMSEATIRATQDRILSLIRLDYETFINSAFLMQGRADEFTSKTAAQRKAILGEILGLDLWVAYEDRAKARVKAIDQEQGQIDAQMGEIDIELAREGQYKDDLIAAQQQLDELHKRVDETQQQFNELQTARNQLQSVQQRFDDLRFRLGQGQAELAHLEAERAQNADRLAGLQALLESREEIEAGYLAWQEARQQERDYNSRLKEQSAALQQLAALRETITAARTELTTRQSGLAQRRAEIERRVKDGSDNGALDKAQKELAPLEQYEADFNRWKEELAGLREEQARLGGFAHSLKTEATRVAAQLKEITESNEAVCPLCGQSLSDEHRAELIESLTTRRDESQAEWQANNDQVEAISGDMARLNRDMKFVEPKLKGLPPLRVHLARLTERLTHTGETRVEMAAVAEELAGVETALAASAYAEAEQAQLAELQAQVAALGYDDQGHQDVQTTVAQYEGYEARKVDLDRALESAPQFEAAIASLDQRIEEKRQFLGSDQENMLAAEAEMRELEGQLVGYDQLESQLNELRDSEGNARANVGRAEQRIKTLGDQRLRREELTARRETLGMDRSVYDDLRIAFGKDGVPAMIIEAAIPEIEEGANQILARMTDGRMNLRFDTQREKVTGGVKETLDIKISDELGTRDYATFSGGETFRVNFAIRLALSRLLARRAGAQLRTLIIDEGFGTQDTQGRERLVQAINAIQEEFDLILVITHIDELKEAFPARIEITKTPAGSLIEMS